MKKRIGILTSGGDCPGLNATIRGVAKACFELMGEDNVEIVGISNGYYGLIHNLCRVMQPAEFSGILTQGGTILGTKRQPFKMMTVIGDDNVDKVQSMKETYSRSAETARTRPRICSRRRDSMSSDCRKRSTTTSTARM